jgi:drug/metabolite transporter (DMT)-like permease
MTGRKGIRNALLSAVLFGLSAPVAKILVGNLAPQLLAGLLYIGSGAGLTIWTIVRSEASRTAAKLHSSDIPFLGGAILFGGIAAPVLLMLGLQRTAASSASLLLNLEAVFTALFAWTLFGENVNFRIAAGLMSIVAGSLILSWSGSVDFTGFTGPLMISAACLCWGIDNNLTQRISAADPVRIASLKGLSAGSVNIALASLFGEWHFVRLIWVRHSARG